MPCRLYVKKSIRANFFANTSDIKYTLSHIFSYNAYGCAEQIRLAGTQARLAVAASSISMYWMHLMSFWILVSFSASKAADETRVCAEFEDRVINSPGEPGISCHMGVRFPSAMSPSGRKIPHRTSPNRPEGIRN
jgi:hypothetical protein